MTRWTRCGSGRPLNRNIRLRASSPPAPRSVAKTAEPHRKGLRRPHRGAWRASRAVRPSVRAGIKPQGLQAGHDGCHRDDACPTTGLAVKGDTAAEALSDEIGDGNAGLLGHGCALSKRPRPGTWQRSARRGQIARCVFCGQGKGVSRPAAVHSGGGSSFFPRSKPDTGHGRNCARPQLRT